MSRPGPRRTACLRISASLEGPGLVVSNPSAQDFTARNVHGIEPQHVFLDGPGVDRVLGALLGHEQTDLVGGRRVCSFDSVTPGGTSHRPRFVVLDCEGYQVGTFPLAHQVSRVAAGRFRIGRIIGILVGRLALGLGIIVIVIVIVIVPTGCEGERKQASAMKKNCRIELLLIGVVRAIVRE
jgi:hypothetical protein